MITPFAISACAIKVARDPTAFHKGRKPRTAATGSAGRIHQLPAGLDENAIYIEESMRENLPCCDTLSYEGNILLWKGKNSVLQIIIHKEMKLLATHRQDRMLVSKQVIVWVVEKIAKSLNY